MLSKFVRPKKRKKWVKAIAKIIASLGIHPNTVTIYALVFAFIAAYFIVQKSFLAAALFVLIALIVDLIDGSVAEVSGKKTFYGNYFDAMIDKFVEAAIYVGLAFHYPLAAILALSGSLLISYAKPRAALVMEMDNHDWPAIGERGDRTLLLFIGLIASSWMDIMQAVLCLIALITLLGAVQRMNYAKKLIKDAEKAGKILPYLKNKRK